MASHFDLATRVESYARATPLEILSRAAVTSGPEIYQRSSGRPPIRARSPEEIKEEVNERKERERKEKKGGGADIAEEREMWPALGHRRTL